MVDLQSYPPKFRISSDLSQAEHDPRFVRTEYYVIAQLLQAAHGYCSGSKRLFELSESYRSSLVHRARCMGLFRSRKSTCPPGASLEERWHAWIRDERFRRLGWGIYVCICQYISRFFNKFGV